MVSRLQKAAFVLVLFIAVSASVRSQITINKSDVDAGTQYYTHISSGYAGFLEPAATVDLGSPSANTQIFDFSHMTIAASASPDSGTQDYISVSGQFDSDHYPSATVCNRFVTTYPAGDATVTFGMYSYFGSEADGFYNYGQVTHQSTSAPVPGMPADTMWESNYIPKQLLLPLPLTYNTTRVSVDTMKNSTFEIEQNTHHFSADAFGAVTFPDGITRQTIRYVDDLTLTLILSGTPSGNYRSKTVNFIASDLSRMVFEVDTNYTGGSTGILSYQFIRRGNATGVSDNKAGLPGTYSLLQNYPNPFNPTTTISYELPSASHVLLKVYNMLGDEIATLVSGEQNPGLKSIRFDASRLASGTYMYRLTAGSFSAVRKLTIVK